jgi:flagellar M-ring protein FliF
MKFSVSSLFKQFVEFYKKLTKKTKIIVFSVLGVIIIGSVIFTLMLNSTTYTALYTGLSTGESSQILSYLQTMAVDVQLKNDGTILVPENQVASLKMQLASEGYPKSTLNYDLFMNQSDLFTTDYERKKLLTFQLQDRLQDSIKTLEGVKDAIVTLSIPDDNSYVLKSDEIDTTASVVLKLNTGVTLSSKQIKGIENLVSNSVPGLLAENVSILSSDMDPLNGADLQQGDNDASNKAETISKINNLFEKSIKDFLKPVFGEKGVSVSVNVKVDFDKVSSTETVYTPVVGENGIISWVKRSGSSEVKGETSSAGGVAGTGSNTVPTYEQSDVTSSNPGNKKSNEEFTANYLVNQMIKEIENSGGNITDMTVAVVVNKKELSDTQKEQYRELVAYGAGVSVEKVALTNAEFFTIAESETSNPGKNSLPFLNMSTDNTTLLLLAVIGIIVIFIIVRSIAKSLADSRPRRLLAKQEKLEEKLRKKEEKAARKAAKEEEEDSIEEVLSEGAEEMINKPKPKKIKFENMPEEIVLTETREQALKRQIKEFSANNPEMVAQLLRIWIKEDDNK